MTLIEYLKNERGAVSATSVSGPNGEFIRATMQDGSEFTVPVGKKSQGANLADYNVLIADDGTAIATINNYKDGETLTL